MSGPGTKWVGKWAGGRIARDRDGQPTWVIERMTQGARYTIALAAGNEQQALAELALFLRDPPAFAAAHRRGDARSGGLVLTEERAQAVLDALHREGRTAHYRKSVADYLVDWGKALRGQRLDMLTIGTLEKLLFDTWKGAHYQRLMALKTFITYHVERREFDASKDPTTGIKVHRSAPAKLKGSKVYTMEYVQRVYAVVNTQHARDVLVLRSLCGMHGTEIERIAAGECELKAVAGHEVIKGTVRFIHKGRHEQINSMDAQMWGAANRLLGKPVEKGTMIKAMKRAQRALGDKTALLPGNLRHSFVTWAKTVGEVIRYQQRGVDLAIIKEVIGHRADSKVTSDVYLDEEIPPMIKLPLRLVHVDDPKEL